MEWYKRMSERMIVTLWSAPNRSQIVPPRKFPYPPETSTYAHQERWTSSLSSSSIAKHRQSYHSPLCLPLPNSKAVSIPTYVSASTLTHSLCYATNPRTLRIQSIHRRHIRAR
ncbi:hypothetical protein BD410DRAFT_324305 [Rickenella mellea]|uniref:Uncharacterized protein n=1 Tax=Rickenella mellea TaxID=50990 RepID=A0A4Y7PHI2_9AGAM|nr:hypothetical protein BD410DRAFT_324305 [Rickenella mellea]